MHFIHQTDHNETIAALATPPGAGGIAIVRVSGKRAEPCVEALVRGSLKKQLSHLACLKTLFCSQGHRLDRALVLVMRAPRSFTGEDIVEIHCHGGHLIAKKILEALFQAGARPAEPGEFSLRAFLNGKIDLAQAEAIQDLISARNEEALKVAEEQLEGRLSAHICSLQKRATELCALFEAWVDFPEEDLGFCSFEEALSDISALEKDVQRLINTFHTGKILQEGVSLCILGAPNVGKSSLMNALLGKERAIVSETAGTTRDLVEDDLMLNGLHCKIVDTAGIRKTDEQIEREGVRRSQQAVSRADVVLAVADASRPEEKEMLAPIKEVLHNNSLLVWNKVDLRPQQPPSFAHPHTVNVSAKTGEGIERLTNMIESLIWQKEAHPKGELMITNFRHKQALESAREALCKTAEGLREGLSPEFIAFEMRAALTAFGSVLGTDITEDVLSSIFSRFCIGK